MKKNKIKEFLEIFVGVVFAYALGLNIVCQHYNIDTDEFESMKMSNNLDNIQLMTILLLTINLEQKQTRLI